MAANYRSKLVGVFGDPVDENPSVVMNEAGFRAKGLDWRYLTIRVRPQDLPAAFAGLRAMHFEGINLTIPHKIAAMELVDDVSEAARMIGAVNIVARRGERLFGDNTDGKGMVDCLRDSGVKLSGRRMVVLGAGGAARAVCVEAALAGCAAVHIVSRDIEKARQIADILNGKTAAAATVAAWEGCMAVPPCDILVNATPVGLHPDPCCPNIRYEDIRPGTFVQDVIPNPADTLFLKRARQMGAATGNGLGMLVRQGAIGFRLWTGEEPPLEAMARALEEEFGA